MTRLLTIAEHARELGLPPNKLYQAVRHGRAGRPDCVAAGHLLFSADRARELLDACAKNISAAEYIAAFSRINPPAIIDV